MAKDVKYAIFKTRWGYFGFAADETGLFRTCLPCGNRKTVEKHLLKGLNRPKFDKNLLKTLQNKLIAYFEGKSVSFNESLNLAELTPFTRKTLAACRKIPPGITVSYSQLAAMLGKPRASRAVGNALAKNPIPLLIPCHRVIRCNGSLGNFSATGGTAIKQKLLALEKT